MKYFKYDGHKGLRYFKLDGDIAFPNSERCVQVCLSPGAMKKGRANCIGVYIIRRLTLLGNYAFLSQLQPCTKKEFEAAKNKVLKMIDQ